MGVHLDHYQAQRKMGDVWVTAAQLQRKILEPRTVADQIAGVRGMIVLVETLFRQGRISEEVHIFLKTEYSLMLNRLWRSPEARAQHLPPKQDGANTENNLSKGTKIEADDTHHLTAGIPRCKSAFTRERICHMMETHKKGAQERTPGYLKDSQIQYALDNAFIEPQAVDPGSSLSSGSANVGPSIDKETGLPFDVVAFVKHWKEKMLSMGPRSSTAPNATPSSCASTKTVHNPFSSAKDLLDEEMASNGKKKERELSNSTKSSEQDSDELDGALKCMDPSLIAIIKNEVMTIRPQITWDDIAGLKFAKQTVTEMIVWPLLRPDIFQGVREPPKGLLLFGPPGTGKTLIGKCIAAQANATFFSISASSLTSKWVGDGEKLVRALFAVARIHQPSVVFVDEIDSLLSQRSSSEHESSRKIKTEFLIQMDGAHTHSEANRVLIIGATNRPQELDEAARRRMVKRIYVPLPTTEARRVIARKLLSRVEHSINEADLDCIAQRTHGTCESSSSLCTLRFLFGLWVVVCLVNK